jgi:hypothetical protein
MRLFLSAAFTIARPSPIEYESGFSKYVLARLAGLDRCKRVPVVGSRHHHCVEILALQQLAEIAERLGLGPARFFDDRCGPFDVRSIHIADRNGIHVGMLQKFSEPRRALIAEPDESELQPIACGSRRRRFGGCGQSDTGGRDLHKGPSAGGHQP